MNGLNNSNIGFIGAGKVGVSLGKYFQSKGLHVAGYYSHSYSSSLMAAEITSSRAYKDITGLITDCTIIFITVPDGKIAEIWDKLQQYEISGRIICHTSGSLSSDIFSGINECGAFGYSIHPMYAFANRDGSINGLEKAFFTIEGDPHHLEQMKELLSGLGNGTIVINPKDKVLYHVANVMASNLVLSLVSQACQCFEECGATGEEALAALLPLIKINIENISRQGFINSLTGPVERNDTGTITKHLNSLPEKYKNIYNDLSLRLVELAEVKHPERDYSQLQKLFTALANDAQT